MQAPARPREAEEDLDREVVLGALSKDVGWAVCLQGMKILLRELRNIIGMVALVYVAYIIFNTVKPPGRAPPHMHMHASCTHTHRSSYKLALALPPTAPRHAASSPLTPSPPPALRWQVRP